MHCDSAGTAQHHCDSYSANTERIAYCDVCLLCWFSECRDEQQEINVRFAQ